MSENNRAGIIQVFTGDGKGKTTAALGQVIRAAGHGLRPYVIFFMKGDYPYGEFNALRHYNIDVSVFGIPCLADPSHPKPEEIEQARLALQEARQAIDSRRYDLIVLDEINVAAAFGLIELDDLVDLLNRKPPEMDLILTGRYAAPPVLAKADLVTEMRCVKHPFDRGLLARKGIEY